MSQKRSYRIVLADDHVLIRHGIKNLLSQNDELEVLGEVSNGEELMVFLSGHQVDLIILDISMPNIGGLEAVTLVKDRYPTVKILIFTMHKSKQYFYHAMMAGAMVISSRTILKRICLLLFAGSRTGKIIFPLFLPKTLPMMSSMFTGKRKRVLFRNLPGVNVKFCNWWLTGIQANRLPTSSV